MTKKYCKKAQQEDKVKNVPLKFREPNRIAIKFIWTEIDNFIILEREKFDKKLKYLEEIKGYYLLKKIVIKYLDSINLISENLNSRSKILIERSIVMIYLLRAKNPPSDRQIALKAGYRQRASIIKKIKIHLGILEETITNHIWMEIDNFITQEREMLYRKLGHLEENEKYHLIKQIIMKYLINKTNLVDRNLSLTKRTSIERVIVIIYLLRSKNSLRFTDIMIKSGHKDEKLIRDIANYFGIHTQLEIDYINQTRVCARCKKMLSFDNFNIYNGKIRSMCIKCDNIRDGINRFQKKLLATIFITLKHEKGMTVKEFLLRVNRGEKFDIEIKCPECGLDLYFLPSYVFHHPNPALKTISWKMLAVKKVEDIISNLDEEQCVFICGNCHRLKKSKFITEHLDEILTENIDWKHYNDNEKKNLRRLIRKKKIFEDLYNGVCFYCKKLMVDKLAIIDFHHTIEELKEYSWSKDLRDNEDIEYVKRILLKEKQVGVCHNCHYMETAIYFNNNKYEIFSKYLSDNIVNKLRLENK
ncbi:MAG: hypothetical protein ACFFCE_09105 [Promethearchaeota archaeon]